jgi:predicted PurR-regulated permease PerM
MNTEANLPSLFKMVLFLAAGAVLLLAMRATSEILAPILLAFVLAICTTPFLHWLVKKGVPGGLALILVIIMDVLILVGLVWLISSSVQNFSASVSQYEDRFQEIEQNLGGLVDRLGVDVESLASDEGANPMGLLEIAAGFAGGLVSGLSNWVTIIMVGIFFLVESLSMPKKLESLTRGSTDPTVQRVVKLVEQLREYMVINAFVGVLAAVANTILLVIVGVEFAVLWGLLSFFFSFVPSVGFIISVIPPAIMALIQFGWQQALIVVVAYIIINGLVDNVIKPRFIEEGVNISATVTFLSLVVWGWVLGPIGAILAVPMSIILQAVFNSRQQTQWLGYLMGTGKDPFDPEGDPGLDGAEGELAADAAD